MNDTKTMQEMNRVLAAMEDEPGVVVQLEETAAIGDEEGEEYGMTTVMGEGALPVDSDDYEAVEETVAELSNAEESSETEERVPSSPVDPPPTEPPPPPPSDSVEEPNEPEEEETATSNVVETPPPSSSSAETDVVLALMGWCNAWNSNNVEAYLDAYDPNATYISESLLRAKVTKDDIVLRGETAIRLLFRNIFSQTKGGETNLRYSQIQVELMGPRHASVFGRFTLTVTKGNKVADTGVFTLCVVKNKEGVWKILSEHSSSSLDPQKKKKKK